MDFGATWEQQRPSTRERRASSGTRRRSQASPLTTLYGLQVLHPRFQSGRSAHLRPRGEPSRKRDQRLFGSNPNRSAYAQTFGPRSWLVGPGSRALTRRPFRVRRVRAANPCLAAKPQKPRKSARKRHSQGFELALSIAFLAVAEHASRISRVVTHVREVSRFESRWGRRSAVRMELQRLEESDRRGAVLF